LQQNSKQNVRNTTSKTGLHAGSGNMPKTHNTGASLQS
jgi:hypothetical protein